MEMECYIVSKEGYFIPAMDAEGTVYVKHCYIVTYDEGDRDERVRTVPYPHQWGRGGASAYGCDLRQ
jgi:hypothetical protein